MKVILEICKSLVIKTSFFINISFKSRISPQVRIYQQTSYDYQGGFIGANCVIKYSISKAAE